MGLRRRPQARPQAPPPRLDASGSAAGSGSRCWRCSTSGIVAGALALLAALAGLAGIALERWLFFAEATHTVMLYYGRRPEAPEAA